MFDIRHVFIAILVVATTTAVVAQQESDPAAAPSAYQVFLPTLSLKDNRELASNPTPIPSSPVVPSSTPVPPPPGQTSEQQRMTQEVVALVNADRSAKGCPALVVNSTLTEAAQRHSENMALADFFGHIALDGSSVKDRANAAGYQGLLGENIAAGRATATAVHRAWMESSGHRANILNCAYREIGIGYYYQADDAGNVRIGDSSDKGPYFHYWVEVFGAPRP